MPDKKMMGMGKGILPKMPIKSNTGFATPGTEFKATKPGTSNQPKTAFKAKSAYMMYGKESDTMTGGSPLAKMGCSKTYKKGALKAEGTVDVYDSETGKTTKVTKENGVYTRGGNVVTLNKNQSEKQSGTRTESYAQKNKRLKAEQNG